MSDFNIRNRIQDTGYTGISNLEKGIADDLNTVDAANQLDLIKLQQKTAAYSNTISMMSTMLKNLAESDKEVIRNS